MSFDKRRVAGAWQPAIFAAQVARQYDRNDNFVFNCKKKIWRSSCIIELVKLATGSFPYAFD